MTETPRVRTQTHRAGSSRVRGGRSCVPSPREREAKCGPEHDRARLRYWGEQKRTALIQALSEAHYLPGVVDVIGDVKGPTRNWVNRGVQVDRIRAPGEPQHRPRR